VPDIAGLAVDPNELCNPTTYSLPGLSEACPIQQSGTRPIKQAVGPTKYFLNTFGPLHGLFVSGGDLPTVIRSSGVIIAAQEQAGMKFDATRKTSARDEQAAFTPRIQLIKQNKSNFVYLGSNDRVAINAMKEAKAQGVDSVTAWSCEASCYTQAMLAAGPDVEGMYLPLTSLPFEEASKNEEMTRYVNAIGGIDKVDQAGASGWQSAVLFKQVIDQIVKADGPNGITRAKILDALAHTTNFTANGWLGPQAGSLKDVSPCFVMMQIKAGKFVRVYPTEPGTMDCSPDNLITVNVDPVVEGAKIQ
jgi:hypothetical protein